MARFSDFTAAGVPGPFGGDLDGLDSPLSRNAPKTGRFPKPSASEILRAEDTMIPGPCPRGRDGFPLRGSPRMCTIRMTIWGWRHGPFSTCPADTPQGPDCRCACTVLERGDAVSPGVFAGRRRTHGQRILEPGPGGAMPGFGGQTGPCSHGIDLEITEIRHTGIAAAPALIPRPPGDRARRDWLAGLALALPMLPRGAGAPERVPDPGQEVMHDLVRACGKKQNGIPGAAGPRHVPGSAPARFPRRCRGTQPRFRLLEEQSFGEPNRQVVMARYVGAASGAPNLSAPMNSQIRNAVADGSLG